MAESLPDVPHKGRGALSNRTGRYEPYARVRIDDGWADPGTEAEPPPLSTTVGKDSSRRVIARNRSPDVPFDRSINPYRGCEHGCVYCFARPTHAWLGLSPGLDFETKLFAKHDAARLLEAELAAPSYQPAVIALGANTDPYQPVERRLGITRQILEVLARARHPVAVVTKSQLVLRDLDILSAMGRARLARVYVSVTTLDPALARRMEPRATSPAGRIETIRGLSQAGVATGVLAAPMIPALNDGELEAILKACAEAGAGSAGYVLLRLPLEIKDLFIEWLAAHFPDRKDRVLGLLREMRGGRLYDPAWGRRMKGGGIYADLLERRFGLACTRLGLDRRDWNLDTSRFRRPALKAEQLGLF
ncbi:MAG: PA0069 family radical SAM protein [Kiloniellaceae bacterium]